MIFKYLATASILLFSAAVNNLFCQLVINELQVAPKGAEPEWVELYNNSDSLYVCSGCTIKDAVSKKSLPDFSLPSHGYAVLVKDTVTLKSSRSIPDHALLVETKMPGLNNDWDELVILDNTGRVIDSIYYNMDWGQAGITLERVYPDKPATGNDNWMPSIAAAGATPGERNSHTKEIKIVNRLSAVPNPFSSNGTSQYSNCKFSYKIPFDNAIINAFIFDYSGRKIIDLANAKQSENEGSIDWDGKDDKGMSLPEGPYIFLLEATDKQSGDKYTDRMMIVIGK
jgi:hypothetical protein